MLRPLGDAASRIAQITISPKKKGKAENRIAEKQMVNQKKTDRPIPIWKLHPVFHSVNSKSDSIFNWNVCR